MCSSDVVIKSLVLTGYEMEFLRRRTKSTIIQNHAGSPETYEKYWLKDEQLSQDMNVNLPPYVRFCLMFDKILFQSKLQAQECESKHKKLAGKSLVLLPTCNESEAENAARSHSPFPSDQIALINVGVLSPRKAQLETIQAFEKIASNFPNLRLYFLGSTTMWKQYYKEIFFHVKEFGLDDKIRFLGHRGDYLRYMAHADCIIQTSRAEGVSRVLRESMFLKLPIVSYAISGTVDLVKNGSEALLVDPGDVEGLSKALTTLLTDESRREDLAERAHDKYLLRHANQVYRSNLVKLFSSVQRRSGG